LLACRPVVGVAKDHGNLCKGGLLFFQTVSCSGCWNVTAVWQVLGAGFELPGGSKGQKIAMWLLIAREFEKSVVGAGAAALQ